MNTKIKAFIGIIVFAAFIGVAALGYNVLSENFKPQTPFGISENESESELENEATEEEKIIAAIDFNAFDNDGNEVKLSDYFGKPIVLNFWASWCPPCKSEMPHFNKVYEETKDDVVFLMVDMVDGMQETEAKGKKYIEDNNFAFPVLFDTEESGAYAYGIRSIPTTIFINKDGNIVTGFEGAMTEEALREGINLIKGN